MRLEPARKGLIGGAMLDDDGYDPVYDRLDEMFDSEPSEPNCFGCWDRGCRSCRPPVGRELRRLKRRARMERRRLRQAVRRGEVSATDAVAPF